jgi:class 3 adenylate cyclase
VRRVVEEIGLRIRGGVHAGELERDERGGVSGLAVHIGARVMAAADPGEVLVSGTVKDLVVGSGLAFADRGPRTLKGVPGTWPVFAVVG